MSSFRSWLGRESGIPGTSKNVATAGGCLASHYLAGWILARLEGREAAESALRYVAPAGEKEEYVERALRNITPYLREELTVG